MATPLPARMQPATYRASPNIALVKYWGMRDVERGLPNNSSLSVTLGGLSTTTTVGYDESNRDDQLTINGKPVGGNPLDAVRRFLDHVRHLAKISRAATVVSENNFPTASGLASSASGFAALAGAATAAAGLRLGDQDLSRLARLGSGSATRSILGGFVEWRAGSRADGTDSYAVQLFPPDYWPELVDLVVLVEDAPTKEIRSAQAMQWTVKSSPFYAQRLQNVPRRLDAMKTAIRARDASRLFPLIMEECDDFRRVCESTHPRLDYLTATSREILRVVRTEMAPRQDPMAAYTHDAGAHVHVFTTDNHVSPIRDRLGKISGVARILALKPGPGGRLMGGAAN